MGPSPQRWQRLLSVSPASAEIVTCDYTGVVNHVAESSVATGLERIVASSDALPGGVRLGQTFSGQFSYDTAIAGSPGTPVSRWYAGSATAWQPASTVTPLGTNVNVGGLLTSITRITPVPEADSWAMLIAGVGIVGAGALRRRVRATTT